MFCWTHFHLSYLYSHWIIVGINKVDDLDYAQQRLRLQIWYYVVIFLCRKISLFPELLASPYLYSLISSIGNIAEVKKFSQSMRERKLDQPAGVGTKHWVTLESISYLILTRWSKPLGWWLRHYLGTSHWCRKDQETSYEAASIQKNHTCISS